MNRYHKDVYFSQEHAEHLAALVYQLNNKDWRYTAHCLDNARLRILNIEQLLYFIKNDLKIDVDGIFEYYIDEKNNIEKICYRFRYNNIYDIILVIGNNKEIITIYINSAEDKHETLKKELYARP